MEKFKNWQEKVENLLLTGSEVTIPVQVWNDTNINDAISLISYAAVNDADWLLTKIFLLNNSMTMVALTALASNAPTAFLDKLAIKDQIFELLLDKNPNELLEFTEYLKSKMFGKGLGARTQKWIRRVMESWGISVLEVNIHNFPKSTYSLIKLIHPRFNGNKGELIKVFLTSYN